MNKKTIILLLCFTFSCITVNAQQNYIYVYDNDLNENIYIIGIESYGDKTVTHYISEDANNIVTPYTTSKKVTNGWKVDIDNVFCYSLRHDVTFAYGIPTGSGEKAQILSYKAYIEKVNSSSAYYPDTSSMTDTLTKLGNPAILKTSVTDRYKSNNKAHGTFYAKTKCYGNGSYTDH